MDAESDNKLGFIEKGVLKAQYYAFYEINVCETQQCNNQFGLNNAVSRWFLLLNTCRLKKNLLFFYSFT